MLIGRSNELNGSLNFIGYFLAALGAPSAAQAL